MTLNLVSKSFPLQREDPFERSCLPDTDCLFDTPLSLGMRIGGENMLLHRWINVTFIPHSLVSDIDECAEDDHVIPLTTPSARIRMDRTNACAKMDF